MRVGSLFSGIGGLDLGLERAGMEIVWQVEIDAYCQKVLAKHWPQVRRHDDVRTFPPEPVEEWKCDLICGGFPCQPVSVNGARRGDKDERWLWPEFARIIRLLGPRLVLLENVPGLLDGWFGIVLGDLAEIGFDAEWQSISAASVGAPHVRERVFVIAHPTNERCQGYFAPSRTQTVEGHGFWSDTPIQQKRKDEKWLDWIGRACEDQNRAISSGLFRRVADGVPDDLDGYRACGNAILPQVAEWIGKRIMESET